MKEIHVTGFTASVTNAELGYAAEFFGIVLLPEKLDKNICVHIHVGDVADDSFGSCIWTDNNHRPRIFYIEIKTDMTRAKTIKVLAHEMTHLKQYAKGELKDFVTPSKRHLNKWKGETVERNQYYWTSPWEIDAYGHEPGLWEMYNMRLKADAKKLRQKKKEWEEV